MFIKKYQKSILIAFGVIVILWSFFGIKQYLIYRQKIETTNICQNDELITKLITRNINPFSKLKFLKKRNTDCNVLLAENKITAETEQPASLCSLLDSSTVSITTLIDTYVKDLYDRKTAGKKLRTVVLLMQPYNYCEQYYADMMILIEIKQKYGLFIGAD